MPEMQNWSYLTPWCWRVTPLLPSVLEPRLSFFVSFLHLSKQWLQSHSKTNKIIFFAVTCLKANNHICAKLGPFNEGIYGLYVIVHIHNLRGHVCRYSTIAGGDCRRQYWQTVSSPVKLISLYPCSLSAVGRYKKDSIWHSVGWFCANWWEHRIMKLPQLALVAVFLLGLRCTKLCCSHTYWQQFETTGMIHSRSVSKQSRSH